MVEFSPQSESGLLARGGRGLGAAEVTVGKMVQDHTAGPSGMSDTAAPTLLLRRHLVGRREYALLVKHEMRSFTDKYIYLI